MNNLSNSEEGEGEEIVMHMFLTVLLIAQLLTKFFRTAGVCHNFGCSNMELCVVQTKLIVPHPFIHVFCSDSVHKLSHRYNDSIIFQILSCVMHYDEFTNESWVCRSQIEMFFDKNIKRYC